MATKVTLTVPDTTYQQAKELAQITNREVEEVLTEPILFAFPSFYIDEEMIAMQREEDAYDAMRAELLANYLDQYVAVYQGVVVDHDYDQIALLRRLDEQYPDEVVLMRKVTPHPRRTLYMRSRQKSEADEYGKKKDRHLPRVLFSKEYARKQVAVI